MPRPLTCTFLQALIQASGLDGTEAHWRFVYSMHVMWTCHVSMWTLLDQHFVFCVCFFTVSNDQTCEHVNAPMFRQLGNSSAKCELSTVNIRSQVNKLVKGRRKLSPFLLLVSKALRTIKLNGILVYDEQAEKWHSCGLEVWYVVVQINKFQQGVFSGCYCCQTGLRCFLFFSLDIKLYNICPKPTQ